MCLRWIILTVLFSILNSSEGALRRCFQCRSRGELGTCKDPFRYNSTLIENVRGVETIPCASGWCAKIIEAGSFSSDTEYGVATDRMCLARGPSDAEERCAKTERNHKKVYMCFCQGDLCNNAMTLTNTRKGILIGLSILYMLV